MNRDAEFDRLYTAFEAAPRGTPDFLAAFAALRAFVEAGYLAGCGWLAELQATEPSIFDPEAAYRWYYIALQSEGYSTAFQNERSDGVYTGPVGDFRNEGMVAGLVDLIGLDRLPALDAEAEAWLARRSSHR